MNEEVIRLYYGEWTDPRTLERQAFWECICGCTLILRPGGPSGWGAWILSRWAWKWETGASTSDSAEGVMRQIMETSAQRNRNLDPPLIRRIEASTEYRWAEPWPWVDIPEALLMMHSMVLQRVEED